jgi:transcriptional regulator with XRE-family HTH domain
MSIGISRRLRYAILLKQARDGQPLEDKEIAAAVWRLAGLRPPTATTISRYLNGARQIPTEMLPYFSDFLGCDLRWLILGDGDPPTLETPAPPRKPVPPGAVDAANHAAHRRRKKGRG